MNDARDQLRELLRILAHTQPREIDCGEFLTRVGGLLETLERAEPLPEGLRLVSQHLDICPECKEEFDALMELHQHPPSE
jgi:hypothetical protein